jgi:hypothetical protein
MSARHALTYQLGGSIPVQAEFVVTPDGGLDLSDAALGGHVVEDLTAIGERRGGIWYSLEELLTEAARQKIESWIKDEPHQNPELREPGYGLAGSSSRKR